MTIVNGRFVSDSVDDVLDVLVSNFETNIGDTLSDGQTSLLRTLYTPVAEQLVLLQNDVGLVLDSSQIEYAEGDALGLLTALIGVSRDAGSRATGLATFTRETAATVDYVVPIGTRIMNDSSSPVIFETTEKSTMTAGNQDVVCPIRSVEIGGATNVKASTLTVLVSSVPGIEGVYNHIETAGGSDEEDDETLRERAARSVGQGKSATPASIVRAVEDVAGSEKVDIAVNSSSQDNSGTGGLPDHSFEIIASGNYSDGDVAQAILDTMAAGANPYGGANGTLRTATATLPSGTSFNVSFSSPTATTVYVTADVTTTESYLGDGAVEDAIVRYLGGTLNDGQAVSGRVEMGSDVLYGEVEYAIRSVEGVYDVTNLKIGLSDPPNNTTNISLAPGLVPSSDATSNHLTISSTGA
jgi:uncharacterized phage protein gp47/JayE